MASWTDLPIEIRILIIDAYLDNILAELETHEWSPQNHSSAINQVLNLTIALPFLRILIIERCNRLYHMDRDPCCFTASSFLLFCLEEELRVQSRAASGRKMYET